MTMEIIWMLLCFTLGWVAAGRLSAAERDR